MDCVSAASSIMVNSTTEDGTIAMLDPQSVICSTVEPEEVAPWFGSLPTVWTLQASLSNVSDGIHVVTLQDVETEDFTASTAV